MGRKWDFSKLITEGLGKVAKHAPSLTDNVKEKHQERVGKETEIIEKLKIGKNFYQELDPEEPLQVSPEKQARRALSDQNAEVDTLNTPDTDVIELVKVLEKVGFYEEIIAAIEDHTSYNIQPYNSGTYFILSDLEHEALLNLERSQTVGLDEETLENHKKEWGKLSENFKKDIQRFSDSLEEVDYRKTTIRKRVTPTKKEFLSPSFVVLSFENFETGYYDPCAVSLVKVKDGKIVDEYSTVLKTIVNPYENKCIKLDGITFENIDNAPTWEEFRENAESFIGNLPVFSPRAINSAKIWEALDKYYGVTMPRKILSIELLAQRLFPGLPSYYLFDLATRIVPSFRLSLGDTINYEALTAAVVMIGFQKLYEFEETMTEELIPDYILEAYKK